MKILKQRSLCILAICMAMLNMYFPVSASDLVTLGKGSMSDTISLKGCPLVYAADDYPVVGRAVEMFQDDLKRLTGGDSEILVSSVLPDCEAVIVGTLGHSNLIDSLVEAGMIDGRSIQGDSERFLIRTLKNRHGKTQLVIAGSDRRGTAFGITSLSRALGVDPWVWWADVPVPFRPDVCVAADTVSNPPSIKYRGIFINDEDWGMLPWSAGGLDKDLKDIGPNTYAKVCELLLRLKGNMLAPAMHSCTGAFYSHPESKIVADEYGIIITTSHCEPMLFNNAAKSEWDSERDGAWDYGLNRDVILGKFSSRLDEAAPYENIYTVGMRGVHDEAMSSNRPVEEKIALLEQVISDQRELLSRKFGCPASEIPQIFVPYKETLDLYRAGLRLPDDITIIWPDDNYGYMKSLSNPQERKRGGGAGVYYHTSYLGTPHDYLWLCTTPPAFMYSELMKAYATGADRYWLLNVGDIKPAELDIQTFFDLAWDVDAFDEVNICSHQPVMLSRWCGKEYENDFRMILDEHYRLAWSRKPEYMGWEIEWDSPDCRDIRPTEFSFSNYGDASKRINDYSELGRKTDELMRSLPDSLRRSVFEVLGYPVLASEMMNRKFLFAQLNGELAAAGDKEGANYAARLSAEAADSIESLNKVYDSLYDGKWRAMMNVPPGFCAKYQNRPSLSLFPEAGERKVSLNPSSAVEGNRGKDCNAGHPGCLTIPLQDALSAVSDSDVRLVEGFGYDGYVLQLGTPGSGKSAEAVIDIDKVDSDSLNLMIFHLPYFPLHEGHGCRIGVSLDGGEETVVEYLPEEWSKPWKINVLRNSALSEVTLPVISAKAEAGKHKLRLRGIDPGMAIQRIVIDKGDFRPGYVGPDLLTE